MDSQNNYQFSQFNTLGSENVMLENTSSSQAAFSSSRFPSQPLPQSNPMFQPNQFLNHLTPVNLNFQRTFAVNPVSVPISPQIQQPAHEVSFQSLMNDTTVPSENQPLNSSKAPKRKKKISMKSQTPPPPSSRRNWTIEEDIALTKAWLYISCDADIDTGQKLGTLWDRILQAWRNNMGDYDPARNSNGLGCRWGIIQSAVNKFHGAYEQLERNPQSGTTPEQMKAQAYRVYKDEEEVTFKFEHCWEIMKKNPKWCTQQLTKQGASKTRKAGDIELLGDDETAFAEVDGIRRPEGIKATKLKNKQKVIAENGVIEVVSNLKSTLDKQFEINREELELKKEREKKEFELREQVIRDELQIKKRNQKLKEKGEKRRKKAEKRKNEESLVYRDISNLKPTLRKTLEAMQAQILKEWQGESKETSESEDEAEK